MASDQRRAGQPGSETNLDFRIEKRAGYDILVWDDAGCRPATEPEVQLWELLTAQSAPAAAQEAVAWSKMKPVVEGDYYVRGFNLFAPKQYEALVQVRMHHFDGEPAPELVCNLHESTSSEDMNDWSPIVEMSDDFEWRGPLFAAPVTAAPAGSLSPLARIADAFGVTGTWDQIADAVIARSTPAAPGIDLTPLSRAVELMWGVKRTLVDWANDDQKEAIEAIQSVIDASPKGGDVEADHGK